MIMWKPLEVETSRSPLLPSADKNNGAKLRSCISPSPQRAVSAERRRRPYSTPVQDISFEKQLASRKVMPETLWPCTMRSLTVSFQSDTISIPVFKKEKPATHSSPNRGLRPWPIVTAEAPKASMASQKRSPLKRVGGGGKNGVAIDQTQNLFDEKFISSHSSSSSSSSEEEEDLRLETVTMSRLLSTNRATPMMSKSYRCINPMSSPTTKGNNSPYRFRQSSSPSRKYSTCPNSVLSFIVDMKRGNKCLNNIEDVHRLRLLYNSHLQWRFVNAQALTSLHLQRIKSEKKICNAWRTAQELRDSVVRKRTQLHQQKLKFKLCGILIEQMRFLSIWSLIEREHTSSLADAIKDLRSSILQLPIITGAMANVETLKNAVGYTFEVMQAMGSSLSSIISLVDGADCLVSEMADAAKQGRAMIAECEVLLASTTSMLVEEYSLRTQLVQLKHDEHS